MESLLAMASSTPQAAPVVTPPPTPQNAPPSSPSAVDVGLQSRVIAALGLTAVERIVSTRALFIGCGGAAAEAAKNLVLSGVAEVLVCDPTPLSWGDLSENSFVDFAAAERALKSSSSLSSHFPNSKTTATTAAVGGDGSSALPSRAEATVKGLQALSPATRVTLVPPEALLEAAGACALPTHADPMERIAEGALRWLALPLAASARGVAPALDCGAATVVVLANPESVLPRFAALLAGPDSELRDPHRRRRCPTERLTAALRARAVPCVAVSAYGLQSSLVADFGRLGCGSGNTSREEDSDDAEEEALLPVVIEDPSGERGERGLVIGARRELPPASHHASSVGGDNVDGTAPSSPPTSSLVFSFDVAPPDASAVGCFGEGFAVTWDFPLLSNLASAGLVAYAHVDNDNAAQVMTGAEVKKASAAKGKEPPRHRQCQAIIPIKHAKTRHPKTPDEKLFVTLTVDLCAAGIRFVSTADGVEESGGSTGCMHSHSLGCLAASIAAAVRPFEKEEEKAAMVGEVDLQSAEGQRGHLGAGAALPSSDASLTVSSTALYLSTVVRPITVQHASIGRCLRQSATDAAFAVAVVVGSSAAGGGRVEFLCDAVGRVASKENCGFSACSDEAAARRMIMVFDAARRAETLRAVSAPRAIASSIGFAALRRLSHLREEGEEASIQQRDQRQRFGFGRSPAGGGKVPSRHSAEEVGAFLAACEAVVAEAVAETFSCERHEVCSPSACATCPIKTTLFGIISTPSSKDDASTPPRVAIAKAFVPHLLWFLATAQGGLAAYCSIVGGYTAQEVMKYAARQYRPTNGGPTVPEVDKTRDGREEINGSNDGMSVLAIGGGVFYDDGGSVAAVAAIPYEGEKEEADGSANPSTMSGRSLTPQDHRWRASSEEGTAFGLVAALLQTAPPPPQAAEGTSSSDAPAIAYAFGNAAGEASLSATDSATAKESKEAAAAAVEASYMNFVGAQFVNTRYQSAAELLGGRRLSSLQRDATVFVVGAGAVGCEYLKNLAMLGVGVGGGIGGGGGGPATGAIIVTDGDHIERSNLTRQFLFRDHHVGRPKSQTAAAVVRAAINPKVRIRALTEKVCEQTCLDLPLKKPQKRGSEAATDANGEGAANDEAEQASPPTVPFGTRFWARVTVVAIAVDNNKARRFLIEQCRRLGKPIINAGTLGPQWSVDSVVPFVTALPTIDDGGDDGADGNEGGGGGKIPQCTLHFFPSNINHCIQFAVDAFAAVFRNPIASAQAFAGRAAAYHASHQSASAGDGSNGGHAHTQHNGIAHPAFRALLDEWTSQGTADATISGLHEALITNPIFAAASTRDSSDDVSGASNNGIVSPAWEGCVAAALRLWHTWHVANINRLLRQHPPDAVDPKTGRRFWSQHKVPPRALRWGSNGEEKEEAAEEVALRNSFVVAAARLFAVCYGASAVPIQQQLNTANRKDTDEKDAEDALLIAVADRLYPSIAAAAAREEAEVSARAAAQAALVAEEARIDEWEVRLLLRKRQREGEVGEEDNKSVELPQQPYSNSNEDDDAAIHDAESGRGDGAAVCTILSSIAAARDKLERRRAEAAAVEERRQSNKRSAMLEDLAALFFGDPIRIERLLAAEPSSHTTSPSHRLFGPLAPQVFEKDDDTNHHVAFVAACSNSRARCYGIPMSPSLLDVRRVAGRILPALVTTTAVVSGVGTLMALQCAAGVATVTVAPRLIRRDHTEVNNSRPSHNSSYFIDVAALVAEGAVLLSPPSGAGTSAPSTRRAAPARRGAGASSSTLSAARSGCCPRLLRQLAQVLSMTPPAVPTSCKVSRAEGQCCAWCAERCLNMAGGGGRHHVVDPNTAMSGGSVYYALRALRSNVLRALFVCGGVSVASAHNTSLFACDGEALRPLLTLHRHTSSPDPSANAADAPIVIDASSATATSTSATSSFFVLHAPLPTPPSSSSPHEPLRSNVAVLAYASPWDIAVVRMRRDVSARAFATDVAPEWLRRRCAIMGSPLLSATLSSSESLGGAAEGAAAVVGISLGDVLKGGLRLQCLVDVATGALTLLPPPIPPIGDGDEGIVISDAVVDASVALDCGLGARTRLSLRSRYAVAATAPPPQHSGNTAGDGEGLADDGDDADDEEGPFDFYYVLDAQRNERGGQRNRLLRGLGAAGAQLSLELTAPLPTFRLGVE